MARKDSQLNLRIPEELKQKVIETSTESGRTITAEVNYLLRKGLENEDKMKSMNERIIALESRYE